LSVALGSTPEPGVPQFSGRLASFRLIPRIETYPKIVAFSQTIAGKLVLLALFGLGLSYYGDDWQLTIACLALIAFLPSQRRMLVTFSTLLCAFVFQWKNSSHPLYFIVIISLVCVLGGLLFWSAVLRPRSWFGRRPILFLLCGYAAFVVFASYFPRGSRYYQLIWDFTYILTTYVWFIGYSLLDSNAPDRDDFGLQLGTYRPFWGSTNTPFVKGAGYLRRIEARDAEQLAVTQLKGLKLLVWSILLSLFLDAFNRCIYVSLRFHTIPNALYLSANHRPLPWYACWASLIAQFFYQIISLSVLGHRIVACGRMAGFNALRNTYRPLSSRTVAEFFNRYFFYFKELLVDFFFYPTFLRYFKKHRKLRLIAAIFAAACFGNAFFHFARDLDFIQNLGLARALAGYQVYLFYCAVLAAAISISQLRHRGPAQTGFIRGQLWPSFLVALFYCLLDVFGSSDRSFPLTEHFRFFAQLFHFNL
jgi:hypothetical protein